MGNRYKGGLLGICILLCGLGVEPLRAQSEVQPLPYGDMDQWVVREITESAVIGKHTRTIHAVGPVDTIVGNRPYRSTISPWGSSNVMAKVSGITKASASVYPERRGEGYAARMETGIESVSALGIVRIKVLVGGCLFLGRFLEPAKNSSDTWGQIDCGMPFDRKPTALLLDYKTLLSGEADRIHLSGMGRQARVAGIDQPSITLYLQKRWEDAAGNIYAKRIGTLVVRFSENQDWTTDASFPIRYGDLTIQPGYKPYMGLQNGESARYALNQAGKNVPIQEVGWGTEAEGVTHLILEFCSSHGGSYIGSPGNTFWVDNVRLAY